MSTSAAFASSFARREPRSTALATALPAERVWEHLVVLAPLCLVPVAWTPIDILALTLVFALLMGADAALAALGSAGLAARQWHSAALLGAGLWLATAPVLGTGAMVTFGLFLVVRCLDLQVPAAAWPIRLGLAALATALVIDLSLVTLAVERSIVWLALAAAIGTAQAAARMLAPDDSSQRALAYAEAAAADRRRVRVEAVLATALVLVIALYGALLAHEPSLVAPAIAGGYLTVPLVALAALRLALLGLSTERRRGVDLVACALLASWALAAASVFSQA